MICRVILTTMKKKTSVWSRVWVVMLHRSQLKVPSWDWLAIYEFYLLVRQETVGEHRNSMLRKYLWTSLASLPPIGYSCRAASPLSQVPPHWATFRSTATTVQSSIDDTSAGFIWHWACYGWITMAATFDLHILVSAFLLNHWSNRGQLVVLLCLFVIFLPIPWALHQCNVKKKTIWVLSGGPSPSTSSTSSATGLLALNRTGTNAMIGDNTNTFWALIGAAYIVREQLLLLEAIHMRIRPRAITWELAILQDIFLVPTKNE